MNIKQDFSQKIPFGFYYWSIHSSRNMAEESLFDPDNLSVMEMLQAKVIEHKGKYIVCLPDYNTLLNW